MYKSLNIMSYNVFVDELSSIEIDSNKKQIINTINPHSYITAKKDKSFERALRSSDTLIPDGSGIVLAAKQINNVAIKKIAGSDLHQHLLNLLNKNCGSVFYMGAAPNTLKKIRNRIAAEFPNVRVKTYSPPYKSVFSNAENNIIVEKINDFNPDVLFIGMTAPKQEKWLYANSNKINFKVGSSIGAVFDFYAGTVNRPSEFWINLNLEWLPRLLKEPQRLWKRNFVSTSLFIVEIILYKLNLKKITPP